MFLFGEQWRDLERGRAVGGLIGEPQALEGQTIFLTQLIGNKLKLKLAISPNIYVCVRFNGFYI